MSTVQEIEQAILGLPRREFEALAEWMDRQRETEFDRQLSADAASGQLDIVFKKLENENAGQPDLPLDEFLRHRRIS